MQTKNSNYEYAKALAKCTGSIGATVIEERRDAQGNLIEVSRATWTATTRMHKQVLANRRTAGI